ncbi:ATP-binding protein [Breznakiella homolactica]|uniref:histidine kinase n=1 Tax=Breznakiella homolactica TaxID=2798577 RepID=A0A7T7XRS2_9SPIR|nr:ATP-binding protein [Breznakiella homolactica]QQO11203.1 Hpt domain-containing protein [Breznakiella homolactica]
METDNIITGGAFDRAYKNRTWEAEKQLTVIRGFAILLGFVLWCIDYFWITRKFSDPVKLTLILLSVASLQSLISYYVVIIRNRYTPAVKYFNQFLDIITVTGLIYVYKLGNYNDYAQVYISARNFLYYIVIVFAAIRIDPKLVIGSGILSILLYSGFIIYGNEVNGLVFSSSVWGQRALYLLNISILEIALRVVFLAMFTAVTWFQVQNQLRFLREAVSSELESQELKRKNELIDKINQENRKYLDNIDEGLLIINEDLNVGDLYSEAVKSIFGTSIISGRPLVSLFYPDDESSESKELRKFLSLLIKNIHSDISMFEDVNPLKSAKITVPSKTSGTGYEEKYLSVTFKQIKTLEGDTNIIALISDQTETRQLQEQIEQENTRHQREIEIIASLLETDPAEIQEFIQDSEKNIAEILAAAEKPDFTAETDEYNKIFSRLHSMKGLSGSLELRSVSWLVHEAESSLKQHHENMVIAYYIPTEDRSTDETKRQFIGKLDGLTAEFRRIRDLRDRLVNYVSKTYAGSGPAPQSSVERIRRLLEKTILRNAETLGKEARLDFTCGEEIPENAPILKDIKEALVHLVNNSLDHGVEEPMERMLHGKPEAGTISVSLRAGDNTIIVSVSDDGRGLDTGKIRDKMRKDGLIDGDPGQNIDDAVLLKNIFKPGYSSKDDVSMISGRGVGLSAVADVLAKYRGKINVKNKPGHGLSFTMVFPLGTEAF